MKKYDERETLFSRVSLTKDSENYTKWYRQHPSTQQEDDDLRGISFRNSLRKSETFKQRFFPLISNNKLFIKQLHDLVEQYPIKERQTLPKSFANNIKEITKYYGATSVGIIKLKDDHYYEHFGGVNEELGIFNYGEAIKKKYTTAIVFTITMDKTMINRAPHYEELLATEEAYLKVAQVGARLAVYIKSLGYRAICNHSEYYLAPMVPLAYDAGLGEIGLCNHIVTKEHGNNVRLGAVFTTLEVDTDQPIDFGLYDFCKKCTLCLMNCPSKSITHKERMVNGRRFYKFNDTSCYNVWVKGGTDCGTCIQSCPFTQGLDITKVNQMKDNPKMIDELMKDFLATYGRRNYTKKELQIVEMKDESKN